MDSCQHKMYFRIMNICVFLIICQKFDTDKADLNLDLQACSVSFPLDLYQQQPGTALQDFEARGSCWDCPMIFEAHGAKGEHTAHQPLHLHVHRL